MFSLSAVTDLYHKLSLLKPNFLPLKKPAIDPKRHSALSNKMKAVKERIKKWEMKVAE